ncbi:MAG: hypothetical protein H6556_09645 [Lewinellaceae bacterium]|nr:hypothetical protein [Lewinellaceae bacterium]
MIKTSAVATSIHTLLAVNNASFIVFELLVLDKTVENEKSGCYLERQGKKKLAPEWGRKALFREAQTE